MPMFALLTLLYFWILLPLFVFGGAGCRYQFGINDRAIAHRYSP